MATWDDAFSGDDDARWLMALRAQYLDWKVLLDGDDSGAEWLVEPLLALGRGHSLFAPAKARKSLLALALAAAVAAGKPILGRPASDPAPVLYVDYEMTPDDVKERVQDMGYEASELDSLKYLQLPANLPPLDTDEGGRRLAITATHEHAQLVVIDTTGRAISGGENEADTFLGFYQHTGRRLKALGCTYLRLDHAGKDYAKGQRGSSAKNDDVDIVWSLEPRDSLNGTVPYVATATHRRMGWVPATVPLSFSAPDDAWMTWTWTGTGDVAGFPAGTKRVIDLLDALQVPDVISNREARAALKAAGETAKGTLLAAAVRFRRDRLAL